MSMKRVPENQIVKGRSRPDSFYDYLTSRFLAKPFSPVLIALGIKNPNAVTIVSFLILAAASALLVMGKASSVTGRVVIAFFIQLSFTLDCADGQIARVLKKTSLFGAWFDKYLDRLGEMMLYASIGYTVWLIQGRLVYFAMGLFIGFSFTMYTLLFTLRDGVFYEEIKKNGFQRPEDRSKKFRENAYREHDGLDRLNEETGSSTEHATSNQKQGKKKKRGLVGRRLLKDSGIAGILPYLFFYLNIGTGERYFYPILFTLLNRYDIMLIIVSVLVFLRTSNVFLIQKKKLKTAS